MQQQQPSPFTPTIHSILGDLVAHYPNSAPTLLNEESIDYCCGGQRSLLESVGNDSERAHQVLVKILSKEEQVQQQHSKKQEENFLTMSAQDLVNHIIEHHHKYLRENIPKLSELLLKIYTVHTGKLLQQQQQGNAEETRRSIELLENMYRLFMKLSTELLIHLVKEEKEIFPTLVQYLDGKQHRVESKIMKDFIEGLLKDHNEAGDAIKELASMRKVLPNYCKTVELTKKLLVEMEENLYIHVHLENNILFKRLV
ncbi:hypothetical protein C9374_007766 [Naegleria lovaniensis]|uniref:Hemerythrin-like domain-containing protein n=1 Tax=Naegleria lovaniensis TaxID=51637 RepID=A0AA88GIB7_NAELO|nr:uncharacterized protein C9374_007766 [Naegleria lovaniensis]KAG2379128.1 hypothetical protein C9374_007766 [Naegleria lovaniensis]